MVTKPEEFCLKNNKRRRFYILKRKPKEKCRQMDPDFNHPGEPPLETMFNKTRLHHPISIKNQVALLMWAPFGLVLACIRFVSLFVVAMPLLGVFHEFDAEKYYWRYVMRLFGFVTHLKNRNYMGTAKEAPIIVCNHVTDLDGIAFFPIVHTNKSINLTTVFLKPLVNWAKILHWPIRVVIRESDPTRKHLTREKLLEAFDDEKEEGRRLFILTEGATTNGQVGLLQYNRFVFSLNRGIQPMCLRINPHISINVDKPSKNMFPNLFWFFFCPYVTYEFTALPVQYIGEDETPEQFAHRVQKMTADKLQIACTSYSYKDKNKMKHVVR
ncbi:putative ancient ubiquitous protein 1 [Monocercomonoides exilis]|uniref:putative ancient ubiquitous protein 1 n=1 Tax=Monocercomonoides exilis TaxID=2049356 RepID=UPI0035598D60|nr:putative ancient ubiquitous protein 1 [Monocercomonoides exilis]|eukprot:MONOS_5243.1-p1 / transcript=MONOS_5243.1 / gene=MONOS_5243 / organism=Monocercomonoides_exilis_PA203 / gene_product=unspecified product / transcript_product=unspecified product / location=Mono_scaffold00150:49053-50328(+) / protein_length=327 / sequence_SO=supercontig / SO=protein_coding / is_pseudo=false